MRSLSLLLSINTCQDSTIYILGGVRDQMQWEPLGKHPTTEQHPRPFFLFIGECIFSATALLLWIELLWTLVNMFLCRWRLSILLGMFLRTEVLGYKATLLISWGAVRLFPTDLHDGSNLSTSLLGLIPAGTVCGWLVICILGARRPLRLFETYSCI